MFARWIKLTLVFATALSLGLHWPLLQTVAWVGMVVNYSQDGSLGEAVAKTFSGKNPCSLCVAVQKGQQEQQEKKAIEPMPKLDGVFIALTPLLFPPVFMPAVPPLVQHPPAALTRVLYPPPRAGSPA